jgi:3-deoxy-manno-octulosonate cytidylyltransferase (CMP-KDO synthetase)
MVKAICIIPARFRSERLPGKPLALIHGKPMIQWVYENACQAKSFQDVIVATDHADIAGQIQAIGGKVIMTDPDLPSGTDRVAAVARSHEADIIVNLQGDEPFIDPALLDDLVSVFTNQKIEIATPVCLVQDAEELTDPNLVRVVRDKAGFGLYFSRAVIPFIRGEVPGSDWLSQNSFFRHIGIYAYRRHILMEICALAPGLLENAEKLEQLRWLEHGYRIYTHLTNYKSFSVDTPEDLRKANLKEIG